MEFDPEIDFELDSDLEADEDDVRPGGYRDVHLQSPLSDAYLSNLEKIRSSNVALCRWRNDLHPSKLINMIASWAQTATFKPVGVVPCLADALVRAEAFALLDECEWDPPPGLVSGYSRVGEFLQRVCNSTLSSTAEPREYCFGDLTLQFAAGWWGVRFRTTECIFSHHLFLCMSDMINSRSLVLEGLSLMETTRPGTALSRGLLESVWAWGDSLIIKLGTDGYSFIKMFEPIVIGRLVSVTTLDRDVAGGTVFELEQHTDLKKKADETNSDQAVIILDLVGSLDDPDALNELGGLYKLWGHPCVDIEAGIEANRKVAEAVKQVDTSTVLQLRSLFRMLMIKGHHSRHGRHLNVNLSKLHPDNPVKAAILRGSAIPDTVPLSSYDDLAFEESFDVSGLSILDILSDKALGPTLPELKICLEERKKMPVRQRRTLLRFLSEEHRPLIDTLRHMSEFGVDVDDRVLGVTPKERELKIKARMFSLIPMNLKCYFGGTEKMIADHILPYFPQITMKDDLRALNEKITSAISPSKDGSFCIISLHIDFEKWNLNFRDDLARPVFSDMDDLFGLPNLISQTHTIFETIQYHCHDGINWPTLDANREVVQNNLAWKGQGGGVEGLRQKGWTILTVLIVLAAAGDSNAEFKLTGQGDNQVLVARYQLPRPGGLSAQEESVVQAIKEDYHGWSNRLYEIASKVGMPIKPSESWGSSTLYAYGKNVYLNGRPLRASLKRMSRMFPSTNDLSPSLYSALTSIYANGQSSAYQSSSPFVAYAMSVRVAERAIRAYSRMHPGLDNQSLASTEDRFFRYTRPSCSEDDIVRGVLLGSSCVGGYPVQHLIDFLCLGFPDVLSTYLTWNRLLCEHVCRDWRLCLDNWYSPVLSPKPPDLSMLVQDPTSGNFLSGTLVANVVKQEVRGWMRQGGAGNPMVRSLLEVQDKDEEPLLRALSAMSPLNPALMAFLVSPTPAQFVKEFVGRFDNASSVRTVAMTGERRFAVGIKRAEISIFNACMIQSGTKGSGPAERCPTAQAQTLREWSWGRPDISGVTVPHPLAMFRRSDRESSDLVLTVDEDDPNIILTTLGRQVPYIGSRGEALRQQHNDYTAIDPEKIIKRLIRARRVLSLIVSDLDPISIWIDKLWKSVTSFDYAALSPDQESELESNLLSLVRHTLTKGGSASHQFTVSSHTWQSIPDKSNLARRTPLSRNSHLPSVMLVMNGVLACKASLSDSPEISQYWEVCCPMCVVPVTDTLTGPEALLEVNPTAMDNVEGIWVDRDDLARRLVRGQSRASGLNWTPLNTRAQAVSIFGFLASKALEGNDDAGYELARARDLTWITRDELADATFSWTMVRMTTLPNIRGRANGLRRSIMEGETAASLSRVALSRYRLLVASLQTAGAFYDRGASISALLKHSSSDPIHEAEHLMELISNGRFHRQELVSSDGSWSSTVTPWVGMAVWDGDHLPLWAGPVLRLCKAVAKRAKELKVGVTEPLILDTDVVQGEEPHGVSPSQRLLDIVRSHTVKATLDVSTFQWPDPRPLLRQERILRRDRQNLIAELELSVLPSPRGRDWAEMVKAPSFPPLILSPEINLDHVAALVDGRNSFSASGLWDIRGWGSAEYAAHLSVLGEVVVGCYDGSCKMDSVEGVPVNRLQNLDLLGPLVGTEILLVFSPSWTPISVARQLERTINAISGSAMVSFPWHLNSSASSLIGLIRSRYTRVRVFTIAGASRVARWYVYACNRPMTRKIGSELWIDVVPLDLIPWERAFEEAVLTDVVGGTPLRESNPLDLEDKETLLEGFLGPLSQIRNLDDLLDAAECHALEGIDLSDTLAGDYRKRFRREGPGKVDLEDLSKVLLAVRDHCGVLTSAGTYVVVEQRSRSFRLVVSQIRSKGLCRMISSMDRSSTRYFMVRDALETLDVGHYREDIESDSQSVAEQSVTYEGEVHYLGYAEEFEDQAD